MYTFIGLATTVVRADTLRNQGWLQSGLIYVGKIGQTRNGKPISGDNRDKDEVRKRGRILADQMYVAGLTMLDGLEIPRPKVKDRGILRVYQDDDNERTFLADAEYLGFKDVVQKLPADMVRQRLGPLFEEGSYYVIPDAPFPEAMALRHCEPARLKPGQSSSSVMLRSFLRRTIEVRPVMLSRPMPGATHHWQP